MNALVTALGLVGVVGFVVLQAFRVADRRELVGPTLWDQTTMRTAAALSWPCYLIAAVFPGVAVLLLRLT